MNEESAEVRVLCETINLLIEKLEITTHALASFDTEYNYIVDSNKNYLDNLQSKNGY